MPKEISTDGKWKKFFTEGVNMNMDIDRSLKNNNIEALLQFIKVLYFNLVKYLIF